MDKKKTWAQVDAIIDVLRTGCTYLDFPLDRDVASFLSMAESDDLLNNSFQSSPKVDSMTKAKTMPSGRLFLAQAGALSSPRDLDIGARFGDKAAGKKMADVAELAAAANDVIREEDEDEGGDRASTPVDAAN